jgi:hypothetical protein
MQFASLLGGPPTTGCYFDAPNNFDAGGLRDFVQLASNESNQATLQRIYMSKDAADAVATDIGAVIDQPGNREALQQFWKEQWYKIDGAGLGTPPVDPIDIVMFGGPAVKIVRAGFGLFKAGVKIGAGIAEEGASVVPKFTDKGIARIVRHLSRPGLEDLLGRPAIYDPANARMIERLRLGLRTKQDINFYMHELKESALMNRGIGPRDAHLQTLQWQGIPYVRGVERELYAPDALEAFEKAFGK